MLKKVAFGITSVTMTAVIAIGIATEASAEPGTPLSSVNIRSVQFLENGGKVYNSFSTINHPRQKMKNSVKVSFIEDPYADKNIAIVTTDGSNMNAKYEINGGYYNASLKWPSAYHTEMEITSNDSAQFYKVAPVNTISSVKVTSEVGYTLGGGIKIGASEKGPSTDWSISGGYAWKESVSYDQADYKTVLEEFADKKSNWKVVFQAFNSPGSGLYDRDSYNLLFGNQLFMKSRSYNEGINNIYSRDTVPALTGYGFSPNVIAVITADKTESTSKLKITNRRVSDEYNIEWVSSKWWGTNNKDIYNESSSNHYKVDWKNHNITLLNG